MRFISCLALTALGFGTARAEDAQQVHPEILYLGAGISHDALGAVGDELNPQSPQDYPDVSTTSWKAFVGVRPIDWFAIEADYFGNAASSTTPFGIRSEGKAVTGYAVFLINSEKFDLLFKVGVDRYTLGSGGVGNGTESGSGFAAGVGWQWYFGRVGMRMEYDLERMGTTTGLRVVSLLVLVNLL
jgi:hypothetical protein